MLSPPAPSSRVVTAGRVKQSAASVSQKRLAILSNHPISNDPTSRTPPSENPSYPRLIDERTDSVIASSKPSRDQLKLRMPHLNTDLPILPEPISPSSNPLTISVYVRPRASFVRHSRVLSGVNTTAGGLNSMFMPSQTLRQRQKSIITDLPPELSPVVNLTNAQRLRQYVNGSIRVLTKDGKDWLCAEANLTGNELSIWITGLSKPRYLNIQDCSIVPSRNAFPEDNTVFDLHILQDYDLKITSLRFKDATEMYRWLAAMQLSKFEHTSLNEAFTAVVLSVKGPQLSDIYTLLAHKKRFTKFEWCNVRLPQVSNKWIRVFVAIIPGDAKKNGRMEVYVSDKTIKKNLVLYVNGLSSVYNLYPEDHLMIDFNSIMKLEGEIFVNKLFQYLFSGQDTATSSPKVRSRRNSVSSLGSLNLPAAPVQEAGARSRRNSISSSSSFFIHAPSPNRDGYLSAPGSPTKRSNHFFKKQVVNNFVTTSYFYLMPEPHHAVQAVEIMLRNFVHIIDAFKLYGRPGNLNNDKSDAVSMLFGLPALPHFCYLDLDDVCGVVTSNFDTACLQKWGQNEWRACLKLYLSSCQRDRNLNGTGNVYDLFNSIDVDSDEGSMQNEIISHIPVISDVLSCERGMPPSRLRNGSSHDDFRKLMNDDTLKQVPGQLNAEVLGSPIEL